MNPYVEPRTCEKIRRWYPRMPPDEFAQIPTGGVNLSPPEKRYVGIFEVYPGMAEQYSSYVPHCV